MNAKRTVGPLVKFLGSGERRLFDRIRVNGELLEACIQVELEKYSVLANNAKNIFEVRLRVGVTDSLYVEGI